MGTRVAHCLIFFLLGFLPRSSLNVTGKQLDHKDRKVFLSDFSRRELLRDESKSERDVTTPITTVPLINPMNPTSTTASPDVNPIATPSAPATTNPLTSPTMQTPVSSGGSWCVASQTASQTALQVALDYACGYGGADCSAIQSSGSCYNPNTVHDHASYAFNDYYQRNPVPTSCSFGGSGIITNTDPSSGTCRYTSTSTSSSVLNTTNPTGSRVYGSQPTGGSSNSAASMSISLPLLLTSRTCLLLLLLAVTL